jgi:hypothetical protein
MNKKLKITLALGVATLLFTGCGGGSSGTDTPTTSIEVERGKVYDSVVTDATGKIATKTTGSNIYVFSGTPTYPITASGGWIDLDGDGAMTTNDMELDVNLTSYSTVVTPITTYLADANSATREQKLQELATSLGTTTENLLKVPSKGTKDTIIAANAIFKQMKTAPNTLPSTLTLANISSTLSDLNTTYSQSFTGQTDMATLAKNFEQAVVTANSGIFTKLTTQKIAELQGSTSGITISGAINTASGSSVARGVERGILDSDTKIVVLTNGGETQETYNVASNGSFSIPTSEITGNDMIILAVNGTTKEVYGNLKLSTATDDKLDFVDKSKLANNLNFGTLDNTNLTTTQTIANSNAFSSADTATLQTVARADDALVLAQNKYRNPDLWTRIDCDFTMGNLTNIKDTFSNIATFSKTANYIGAKPIVETELAEWIGVTKDQVKLHPPVNTKYTTNYGANMTYNDTATPSIGVTGTQDQHSATDYNFFDFPYFETFPSGNWLFKDNNGVTKATFSYNGAFPFDSNDKIKIPVPKVKLNINNNKVSSISVQWYVFENSAFAEINDTTMKLIASNPENNNNGLFVYFQNNTGNTVLTDVVADSWNGTFNLNDQNYEIGTNDASKIRSFSVVYFIGGVKYKFSFDE